MDTIAYYDGTIGQPDELTVPFNDRSHFFGDGIYEAAMAANGKIFLLEDHIDRMFVSAKQFDIHIPIGKEELASLLMDLLSRVEGKSHLVYWQVTRGVAPRSHTYAPDMEGKLWAYLRPMPLKDPYKLAKLTVIEDKRFGYCNVKTLNLMPAVIYAQQAEMNGFDEAVLHRGGMVTECAHSNIHIIKGGKLITHPNDELILRGIAKTHLIAAAIREGIPVIERAFSLDELMDADEVVVSASSRPFVCACEVDGVPVGGRDPQTVDTLRSAVYQEYLDYCGIDEVPITL